MQQDVAEVATVKPQDDAPKMPEMKEDEAVANVTISVDPPHPNHLGDSNT